MPINTVILRTNFAVAITLNTLQRSKPQKQHAQMTSIVIVFLILVVMAVYFMYVKALPSPLPDGDLAHGQEVSGERFFQKKAQIFNSEKC